ncbi:hypothetical protein B0H11DRAFT_1649718, partial [Mycena galericulata]
SPARRGGRLPPSRPRTRTPPRRSPRRSPPTGPRPKIKDEDMDADEPGLIIEDEELPQQQQQPPPPPRRAPTRPRPRTPPPAIAIKTEDPIKPKLEPKLEPKIEALPPKTEDLISQLSATRAHRLVVRSQYATLEKATRRALQELDTAGIELGAAEGRRKVADVHLEKARGGVLGIEYI